MKDAQVSSAISIVKRALNKIGMCKRGTIAADISLQHSRLPEIPEYKYKTADEIKSIMKKKRNALHKMLRFIPPSSLKGELQHRGSLITEKSWEKFSKAIENIGNAWNEEEVNEARLVFRKKEGILSEQGLARTAFLDAELESLELEFMTGAKSFSQLTQVIEGLESYDW